MRTYTFTPNKCFYMTGPLLETWNVSAKRWRVSLLGGSFHVFGVSLPSCRPARRSSIMECTCMSSCLGVQLCKRQGKPEGYQFLPLDRRRGIVAVIALATLSPKLKAAIIPPRDFNILITIEPSRPLQSSSRHIWISQSRHVNCLSC